MKGKLTMSVAGAALFATLVYGEEYNYKPPTGYVPDAETAIRIAIAVWEPIYGQKQIASEKPYSAVLDNGVWTVTGSLPPHMLGGVAIAKISKSDATVLRISHGK